MVGRETNVVVSKSGERKRGETTEQLVKMSKGQEVQVAVSQEKGRLGKVTSEKDEENGANRRG